MYATPCGNETMELYYVRPWTLVNPQFVKTRPLSKKETLELCDFLDSLKKPAFFTLSDKGFPIPVCDERDNVKIRRVDTAKCYILLQDKKDALLVKLRYG